MRQCRKCRHKRGRYCEGYQMPLYIIVKSLKDSRVGCSKFSEDNTEQTPLDK